MNKLIGESLQRIRRVTSRRQEVEREAILQAVPSIVIAVDQDGAIVFVNNAAEHFLQASAPSLTGQKLDQMIPADSPLFTVIDQARKDGGSITEYHLPLISPRIGHHVVNVQAAPVNDIGGVVVLSMQERSLAAKIDRQLNHRGAARSISAMAAMLAHEVKNPLSGIRGAAQLLETSVRAEDRPLTRLIQDETDRVVSLLDRMEVFSASGPLQRGPVNIHEVLARVRTLAENSFGKHLRFIENYDPSLPPVYGNRDQLVQVFLNLIKNAAEAAPQEGGEVAISSQYWHGVRFAVSGTTTRMHLPLMISIQDNGLGIPDDLKPHLFEPFITSKAKGTGLGLALVAKIIGDHGGVIEFDSQPRHTVFRIMLPMFAPTEDGK